MPEQTHHKEPKFGHHLGIWYPLIWRLLGTNKFWSPSMWLQKDSALAIDIYIAVWWLFEIICIAFCDFLFKQSTVYIWLFTILTIFRLSDIMFVLLSILIKGNYRRQGDWPSVNRVILLVILNSLEIMILFAVLYYSLTFLSPEAGATLPKLENFFNSLYFSFVTGTSLGYGTPHPVGKFARFLSIVEASSIILVVISVIGYITNEKRKSQH